METRIQLQSIIALIVRHNKTLLINILTKTKPRNMDLKIEVLISCNSKSKIMKRHHRSEQAAEDLSQA